MSDPDLLAGGDHADAAVDVEPVRAAHYSAEVVPAVVVVELGDELEEAVGGGCNLSLSNDCRALLNL